MTPAKTRNVLIAAVAFLSRTDPSWVPDAILAMLTADGTPAPSPEAMVELITSLQAADVVLLTEDPVRHWAVMYRLGETVDSCRVTCREGDVRLTVETLLAAEKKYDPQTMTLEIVEHLDEAVEEEQSRQLRNES